MTEGERRYIQQQQNGKAVPHPHLVGATRGILIVGGALLPWTLGKKPGHPFDKMIAENEVVRAANSN